MNLRELILLSPYTVPAHDSLMLADEDISCLLNGYLALWHPLLIMSAQAAPRFDSPYDYEEPNAGQFFAVPESPPVFMPDDWEQRLRDAGAGSFQSVTERAATNDNFKAALKAFVSLESVSKSEETSPEPPKSESNEGASSEEDANQQADDSASKEQASDSQQTAESENAGATEGGSEEANGSDDGESEEANGSEDPPAEIECPSLKDLDLDRLLDLDDDKLRPFRGLGFGYMHLMALFEAMDHDNMLDANEFWAEMRRAAVACVRGADDACREFLQSAADQLMSAREVLYPVTLHLVDLCLFDDKTDELPLACRSDKPVNVIASAEQLEQLQQKRPELLETLRTARQADSLDLCVGAYHEREDALLPLESQLWNLLKGLRSAKEVMGGDIHVFARKRFAAHPQLPLLLATCGLHKALLLTFDDSALPMFQSTVINWAGSENKQVDAFTRTPQRADSPQTYFHVAHYLNQSIAQDHAATFALLHQGDPPCPWYEDWLELNRLCPLLGTWTTLKNYFEEVMAGEYASASSADEFHDDYLLERTDAHLPRPISDFARKHQRRRRLDVLWSLAAIQRGLAGKNDTLKIDERLTQLEDRLESLPDEDPTAELDAIEKEISAALAARLLSKATDEAPGLLFLNPCSYTRRIAFETPAITTPLPIEGPLKACQTDEHGAKLVVDVPSFGFAWIPKKGPPDTQPQAPRMKLADDRHVRNEFFEAEIDPTTGGLRGLWDQRTRANRIGQLLVFNPGSVMRADKITVTVNGSALGEVVSEGTIRDESDQEKVLARYRQRFRAWLGRPVLDIRCEIMPEKPPAGYPWHAYYGARFAWRDERALVLRGINGTGFITTQTRPQTTDFLEWRSGRGNVVLFTQGLPFLQRQGTRMLDLVMVCEGETCQSFDIALGLDREFPMLTSQGLLTPVTQVEVDKGPPHIGASGWLFHLDATNLLVTSMRPDPTGADAIIARMLEGAIHGTQAEFRCVRNPKRAALVDALGTEQSEVHVYDDAVVFDVVPNDLAHLRIEFS